MVKVSVIIPVYNMEKYLRECLDSVLAQTLEEIEIICIDDGSVDRSYEILKDYGQRYINVVLIRQENRGAGSAKNRGIERAKGKYICFMDPDDYYATDRALEQLYIHAEEQQVAVCGGNFMSFRVDGSTRRPKKWFDENQMVFFTDYGNYYYFTSYIIRRDLIRENDIIFPSYRRYEDPPFFLQVMACAEKFYAVNEMVYAYRVGHKEEKYSLETVRDILKGIYDCFRIAKNYDLTRVYEEHLKYKLLDYLEIIYPYAVKDDKKIWELINKINDISMEWQGETTEIFRGKPELETYIADAEAARDDLLEKCRNADEVVIYGAGEAGRFFLEHYGNVCRHVAGFAVSKMGESSLVGGYRIRPIQEYGREAFVVIAVSRQYSEEIRQNLERLRFENICYAEYDSMRVLEKIHKYD